MGLDLRMPIGLMFSVFGVMLAVYGLFSDRAIYARSLGVNINLVWGLVLLVFGAVMLALSVRGSAKMRSRSADQSGVPVARKATGGK
ncbi:MAG TPA: hypothetical protein VN622_16035 [Clostridia bacterium]|nr:hypothetical protein [Clostridia bacterium]